MWKSVALATITFLFSLGQMSSTQHHNHRHSQALQRTHRRASADHHTTGVKKTYASGAGESDGPRLRPCNSGTLQVETGTTLTLTCDQYTGNVTWYYRRQHGRKQAFGVCDTVLCSLIMSGWEEGLLHSLTTDLSSSHVNLRSQATKKGNDITYTCAGPRRNASCRVDVFTRAVVSSPRVFVRRDAGEVDGTIMIASFYTSLGSYSCLWTERSSNGRVRDLYSRMVLWPQSDVTGSYDTDVQGRCETGHSDGARDGGDDSYTYTVTISPGVTRWTNDDTPVNINMEPCPLLTVENASRVVTCDGISKTPHVTWYWWQGTRPHFIGRCRSDEVACTVTDSSQDMALSRPSYDVSTVTLPHVTRSRFAGGFVRCYASGARVKVQMRDGCPLDVVAPAEVSLPHLTVNETERTIQGRADISRVYSSIGRYSCQWTQRDSTGAEITLISKLTLTPDPDRLWNVWRTQDRSGHCSFSSSLPQARGRYSYTVTISPVNTRRTSRQVMVD